MDSLPIILAVLGVLWSILTGVFTWLVSRLVSAIDKLNATVGDHALDLVEIKTRIDIMKGE